MLKWIRSGAPWIWLTGGAVSISLLSVLTLLLLIGWKGLNYFWPSPVYQWTVLQPSPLQMPDTPAGSRIIGQLYERNAVDRALLPLTCSVCLQKMKRRYGSRSKWRIEVCIHQSLSPCCNRS